MKPPTAVVDVELNVRTRRPLRFADRQAAVAVGSFLAAESGRVYSVRPRVSAPNTRPVWMVEQTSASVVARQQLRAQLDAGRDIAASLPRELL